MWIRALKYDLFCAEGTNPVIDDDGNPDFSSEEVESGEEMIQPKSNQLFNYLAILMSVK